jgi:hypothetical protein
MGQLEDSLKCYEQALAINPHLDCLQQTITEIRSRLDHDASGDCTL